MRSKKNKKKLIIAIVFGLIATISLLDSMNSQKAALDSQQAVINNLNKKIQDQAKNPFEKEKKEDKVTAVLAAEDIKIGDTFVLEALKIEKFNKDEIPENHFKNTAMLVGKKSGRNITKGGFITTADLQDIKSTIDIPNDARAITIPVEKFKGLASHIKAGSRVDILKVANPPEFIAQNIKVVSFEAMTEVAARSTVAQRAKPLDLTAKQASAITFLVPIDLVSKVIDAMFEGDLQIITRNNNDDKIIVTDPELPPPPGSDSDFPGPVVTVPTPVNTNLPDPTIPKPDPKTIEFIKASSVSTVEFDPEDLQFSNVPEEDSLSDEKLKELLEMVN